MLPQAAPNLSTSPARLFHSGQVVKTCVVFLGTMTVAFGMAKAGPSLGGEPRAYRSFVSVESGVLVGINNPNDYVLAPQLVSIGFHPEAECRFVGFNVAPELLLSAIAEPVLHGPENHYFGGAIRGRLIFSRETSRIAFYLDVGAGAGAIDSSGPPHGQGQDFTFVLLGSAGLKVALSERVNISLGVLYQHLSNAGLSEPERPNVGLDAVGPVLSLSGHF
jgi:lipid A 3-O-deacylase